MNWLCTVWGVLNFAADEVSERDVELRSPIPDVRRWLSRRSKTKRGRAEDDVSEKKHPLEAEELRSPLSRAEKESLADYALIVFLIDSGCRLGEACGLSWGKLRFCESADDPMRAIEVQGTRPRGRHDEPTPKSGRVRGVQMSRRLRAVLKRLQIATLEHGPEDLVWPGLDQANFRNGVFARCCKDIGHKQPKQLRDTYASQLPTAGIPVAYIAGELGHQSMATTLAHYAKWIPKGYVPPAELAPGEVPADLIARIGESEEAFTASG